MSQRRSPSTRLTRIRAVVSRFRVGLGCLAFLTLLAMGQRFSVHDGDVVIPGRTRVLREGDYHVQRLVDPLNWIVRPVDPHTGRLGEAFLIRLASLGQSHAPQPRHCDWLRQLAHRRILRLRFGRHRFDSDQVPLAYVFAHRRLVNAEIVARGLAVPRLLPDNSARLQRMIRCEYDQRNPPHLEQQKEQ